MHFYLEHWFSNYLNPFIARFQRYSKCRKLGIQLWQSCQARRCQHWRKWGQRDDSLYYWQFWRMDFTLVRLFHNCVRIYLNAKLATTATLTGIWTRKFSFVLFFDPCLRPWIVGDWPLFLRKMCLLLHTAFIHVLFFCSFLWRFFFWTKVKHL